MEAGLPNGVLNIVHGTNDILNSICDHEDIKAITFSGPEAAGAYIYTRASASRKRAQLVLVLQDRSAWHSAWPSLSED